jgi:hypothetical protein
MSSYFDEKIFHSFSNKLDKIEKSLNTLNENSKKKNKFNLIFLNARGKKFAIKPTRLSEFPSSTRLGQLSKFEKLNNEQLLKLCDGYDLDNQEFYFDHDAAILDEILNFQSIGRVHLNNNYCPIHLQNEFEYWNITEDHLDICCKYKLNNMKSDTQVFANAYKLSQNETEKLKLEDTFDSININTINIIIIIIIIIIYKLLNY